MEETAALAQTALEKNFALLLQQFNDSLNAAQLQEMSRLEQALFNARNIYSVLEANGFEVAGLRFSKLLIHQNELTIHFLRYSSYAIEERYEKALAELEEVKQLCNEASLLFPQITQSFVETRGFEQDVNAFRSLVTFYDCLVNATLGLTKGLVQKNEGRYTDEVALYRDAAFELKKINSFPFAVPDGQNAALYSLVSFSNRTAESYEKKAEHLQEKRKRIEFIAPIDKKVFIVHGHNLTVLHELKDMLKEINIEPMVLMEAEDDGKTLIEKFEHYGRLCAFAFVLVTPDDWVQNKKEKYFQARPNVLFELGWFCGRYGREKVRILRQKDTPLPSDLNGILAIEFTEKLEEVYRRITGVLATAGVL